MRREGLSRSRQGRVPDILFANVPRNLPEILLEKIPGNLLEISLVNVPGSLPEILLENVSRNLLENLSENLLARRTARPVRKIRSEEHTSELQSR